MDKHHDALHPDRELTNRRTLAIAARDDSLLRRLLSAWRAAQPGRWHDEPTR